ncbi:unnamed protein product [Didymodactylos carnosus]|uniref:WD repeat-containing protein 91 n=1 Tax=Didymodactylos carnosus TaxID=1234261 RepID=A0A8S2GDH8_9BILA|nr:unnamed protein product [Didymodactylos carnosus]CAF3497618.1 unnamed protein product [Didymodactylos carnosus]
MASFGFLDDLLREYLHYRGFNSTLRSFEVETLKTDKITSGIGGLSFRADRIVEQLTMYINTYDINALMDYWQLIENRLFSLVLRSTQQQQQNNGLNKIRTNLYRCYLVHAIQSSKNDKVLEFFEKLTKSLQHLPEWKEWFALPFIKNPDENSTFQTYFSKQWNDLFWISLQNFLSMAFYHMAPPKLCSFADESSIQHSSSTVGNIIGQISQTNRASLPISARLDPSATQFPEVIDGFRPGLPGRGQTSTSNTSNTIISKLRSNFLTKPNQNRVKTIAVPTGPSTATTTITPISTSATTSSTTLLSTKPFSESTAYTGNKLLLDDSTSFTQKQAMAVGSVMNDEDSLLFNNPFQEKILDEIDGPFFTKKPLSTNEMNEGQENIVYCAELKNHTTTVIDCKLNANSSMYSTLDVQSHVKIWSSIEDFNILTSLWSRTSALQCQCWDRQNALLLYLGTSVSTIKVLHVLEKKIVNEQIIDKNYPRVMCMQTDPTQDRLFISLASSSRLNTMMNVRNRSGRVVMLDLTKWSHDRLLVDTDDSFITCMNVDRERQLLVLGADGKLKLYDCRSGTQTHQSQRHQRLVQDIHFGPAEDGLLYTIGNDNTIVQCSLSSFDKPMRTYELPFQAVGPFTLNASSSNALQRTPSTSSPLKLYPLGSVFAFDHTDYDTILTCAANSSYLYRLSTSTIIQKAVFDNKTRVNNSSDELSTIGEEEPSTSCVHWNAESDLCTVGNTKGTVHLFRYKRSSDLPQ